MAIAKVQSNSANVGASVNVGNLAFSSNNTAGSLLLCVVRHGLQGVTMSVADSQGNSWQEAGDLQLFSTGVWLFYAANCQAGANTVTATSGGAAATMRMCIAEYSGADTVSPFDATAGATATGTLVSTPLTTNFDGSLLAIGHTTSAASVATPGSGQYTVEETVENRAGLTDGLGIVAGSETGLINLATSATWGAVIASFRPPQIVSVSTTLIPSTQHRVYEFTHEC